MKIFTKQLVWFMLAIAIYTLAFRIGLSHFLDHANGLWVGISAIVYGVAIFITAWFLGKSDGQSNPFFDIGLRFHLSSFLIWTGVSFGWFYYGNPSQYEDLTDILFALMIWVPFLIIHVIIFLVLRRDTIRGIHKSELFNQ